MLCSVRLLTVLVVAAHISSALSQTSWTSSTYPAPVSDSNALSHLVTRDQYDQFVSLLPDHQKQDLTKSLFRTGASVDDFVGNLDADDRSLLLNALLMSTEDDSYGVGPGLPCPFKRDLETDPVECLGVGAYGCAIKADYWVLPWDKNQITSSAADCILIKVAAKIPVWWDDISKGLTKSEKDDDWRELKKSKHYTQDLMHELTNMINLENSLKEHPESRPYLIRFAGNTTTSVGYLKERSRNANDRKYGNKCFPYNSWALASPDEVLPIVMTRVVNSEISLFKIIHTPSRERQIDAKTGEERMRTVVGRREKLLKKYTAYADHMYDVVISIAKGWMHLHRAGFVHRDMSIAGKNVLITRDKQGQVGATIIDLGNAAFCPHVKYKDKLALAKKVEMYQYANVLFQTCFGSKTYSHIPFYHARCGYDWEIIELYQEMHDETHDMRPSMFSCVDQDMINLMEDLWRPVLENTEIRIDWPDVIRRLEIMKSKHNGKFHYLYDEHIDPDTLESRFDWEISRLGVKGKKNKEP